ncbi:MAG TPA: alpha-L-fucosidase [Gemmatimonadales bacterium]|jgi:alpha-L-fucosidase|nr:alpha-L-fucosidase [Gemmatimonadales bacterium]
MSPITRRDFVAATAAALAAPGPMPGAWGGAAARFRRAQRPRPTRAQLAWQRDELALFLHFGVNTFTDREWGDGREDPAVFTPDRLDARQWARAARAAGFRAMILTAKHHDGFCLWPTRTTDHSVARSPWRGGKGDVVREFTDACRASGLKPGLYLSPWDRNAPSYGDSPRYNDMYSAQLTELLTRYGPIHEVWFDGANGEGPNGRRQVYDWPRVFGLVRRLQPDAVMFSDAGPDVRWIGNERGAAAETNWSTMDPGAVPYPGAPGDAVIKALQAGDPAGTVWRPGETDTSIRPGWFHHPAEDGRVRTVDELVELYFTSVGRNSKLLLNVPPTRDGLLHDTDVARLAGMRERLDALFRSDLAAGRPAAWRATGERSAGLEIDLGRETTMGIADLREDITRGQIVARYTLEGHDGERWRPLSRGTTIGYRKLDRFEPAAVRRVRLTIEEALEPPRPVRVRLYDR